MTRANARAAYKAVTRASLQRALIVLALCALFVGALLLRVPLCPLAGVLGIPCPGCGLTRATLALLHGDFRRAVHLHPLVLVIAPIFLWAVGSAALGYIRGKGGHDTPNESGLSTGLGARSMSALALLVMAFTFGIWGARFFGYFGGPVPVQTFADWAKPHLH
jgi:hypothetical protein